MFEFLLGLSIPLVVIAALVLALIIYVVIWEANPGWSVLSIVVAVAVSDLFFGTSIANSVWNQPFLAIGVLAGYLVIGTFWTIFKWWLFVAERKEDYVASFEGWKSRNRVTAEGEELKEMWRSSIVFERNWKEDDIPPSVQNHKARLTNWLMHWPISCFWTMFHDMIKKISTAIVNRIRDLLDEMSKRAFSGVDF